MNISNQFTATLGEIRKGRVLNDLANELSVVIEAVRETGNPGALILKLDIKPVNGDGDQVLITDDINTRVPKPRKEATLFFTDEGGALLREDPRQRDWVAEQMHKKEEAAVSKAVNEE